MKKFILTLILCPILMIAQPTGDKDITGVWKVIASSWNKDTKQYADCEMIKIITKTRWASLMYWPDTKKFAGTGGGTYKWKDGKYIETCEYFTWDSSAVGNRSEISMTLQNGNLIQELNLNTDKFKYRYYAVHEKIDELFEIDEEQKTPQGIWTLTEATYGDENLDKEAIRKKYGQVVKIITPNYFISTFYNKGHKTVEGVTYGTYKLTKDGKYKETVKCWSWDDKSMIGMQPIFDWTLTTEDSFHQKGFLNSDNYDNYIIDEQFKRLEPSVSNR